MITLCLHLNDICNICMALGGLGTVGTLIYMIVDSRFKSKQIKTIQQVQVHQLEQLYEPDIRIVSYSSGVNNEITLSNHGEDIIILNITEKNEGEYLDVGTMKNWFPLSFDKEQIIHIPLLKQINSLSGYRTIIIESRSRLGIEYKSNIILKGTHVSINQPVINNK